MTGFKIVKYDLQWLESFQKSISLGEEFNKNLKRQLEMFKVPGTISPFTAMQSALESYQFSQANIENIAKAINFQPPQLPPSKFTEALEAIAKNQGEFHKSFEGVENLFKNRFPPLPQFNNWIDALNSISGEMITSAVNRQDWDFIKDFEKLTETERDFTDALATDKTEEQESKLQFLVAYVSTFIKKHKRTAVYAQMLLGLLLNISQVSELLFSKPDKLAEEVKELNKKQETLIQNLALLSQQLNEDRMFRTTNRSCYVRLKPNAKTLVVNCLPEGYDLLVLKVQHKWAFVSFLDPNTNFAQTGWVMKKYLDLPR